MSADANTVALAIAPEATFGTLPGSPTFTRLRMTGESFAHSKDVVTSEELRSDRQVPDMTKVGSQATGGINFELSRDEYLSLFEALLCGTWTPMDETDTAEITGQQIIASTPGAFDAVVAGGYVRVAGAATAANNGIKRLLSKSGDTLTFADGSFTTNEASPSITISGSDLRNGSVLRSFTVERRIMNDQGVDFFQRYRGLRVGSAAVNIESKRIVTGNFEFLGKFGEVSDTTLSGAGTAATGTLTLASNVSDGDTVTIGTKTYTFRASPDEANEVDIGGTASITLDNLIAAINAAAGAGTLYGNDTVAHDLVTAAAGAGDTMVVTAKTKGTDGNLIATTETGANSSWGASTLTGGAGNIYSQTTANPILNGTNNVGQIGGSGGAALTEKFRIFNIAVTNNLRGKDALGEEGNFEIGLGTIGVTGRVSAYFSDNSLYQSLITHDDTSISIVLTDDDGDSIAFTLPRVKYQNGNPNATGINTDVMLDIDFTAIRDPDLDATIIISRIDA